MRRSVLHAALVAVSLTTLPSCKTSPAQPESAPGAGGIIPQPIPAGYDFPGERAQLQAWADNWEVGPITAKAWNLWGGLTAGSGQTGGGALPIWETWCGNEEVFTKTCGSRQRPHRPFRKAVQLTHFEATQGASDVQLVSFNKFDPSMSAYLTAMHPGPGHQQYDYTQQTSLTQLNKAWPAGTPIAQRKVQETPYVAPAPGQRGEAAVELKPVMFLVKQQGLTPVPLWQGLQDARTTAQSDCSQGATAKCHPDPSLWYTCVLVDPTHPGSAPGSAPVRATAEQVAQAQALQKGTSSWPFSCKPEQYLYAPLSTLYHFQLNAQEARSFNEAQSGEGLKAEAGDYAVLTAMHVSTKEIVNWTWQTFWWQPGGDAPGGFPGSKAGMTDKVNGVWRNYAMCTSYNQTQGKASKEMVVCFNPYLETASSIPDGVQSNCMSCHGTATVGSSVGKNGIHTLEYPADYTAPIDFENDPRFAAFTRTDFSWAIPGDSNAPPSAP
jgi:hypothetical protein